MTKPRGQPMNSAPKDGTPILAEIPGHGSDNIIQWVEGFVDSDDLECGTWCFVEDQEPPDSWTDGVCWRENEDGVPSTPPVSWRPLPAGK